MKEVIKEYTSKVCKVQLIQYDNTHFLVRAETIRSCDHDNFKDIYEAYECYKRYIDVLEYNYCINAN